MNKLITYFEIFHMEGGRYDFPMVSPFFSFETEETIAFELFNERVSFVFLVEFRLGSKHFTNEIGIGDGEADGGSEPYKKCCTCNEPEIKYFNKEEIILVLALKK